MSWLKAHSVEFLLWLSLAIAIGTVASFTTNLNKPYGGFLAQRSHITNSWHIYASTPPWWPIFTETGLRYGDELIALDHGLFNGDVGHVFDKAVQNGRDTLPLTIRRKSKQRTVSIPVTMFTVNDLLETKLPAIVIAFCYWLLAFSVYRSKPKNRLNRLFGIAGSIVSNSILLMGRSLYIGEGGSQCIAFDLLWSVNLCMLGVALIHLAASFPVPIKRNLKGSFFLLHLFACMVVVFYLVSILLEFTSDASYTAILYSTVKILVHCMNGFAAAFFWARPLWMLVFGGHLSPRIRKQVKTLIIGLLFVIPVGLVEWIRPLSGQGWFCLGLDVRLGLLPAATLLAASIIRYHSFRNYSLSIVIVLIVSGSAVVAGLGAWIMRVIYADSIPKFGIGVYNILFISSLVTSGIWSFQTSLKGLFRRILHWEALQYSATRQFARKIMTEFKPSVLSENIASELTMHLELERAALWLWDDEHKHLLLASNNGDWPQSPPTFLPEHLLHTNRRKPYRPGHDEKYLVELFVPVWASDKPLGILGLGKRWDDEIFDDRDLEIVELIAQQVSMFLLVATQIEKMRRIPAQIAAAQEKERFVIAQELHDTIAQFLGRLPFALAIAQQQCNSNMKDTYQLLERTILEIEEAARTVREITNNLAPRQLKDGFVHSLINLIETFGVRSGIKTSIQICKDADDLLSSASHKALYRIMQQALDNVGAHSNATVVEVTILESKSKIHFSILDNGKGLSANDIAVAKQCGRLGIRSMKARIALLGGEFVIERALPTGTRVRGFIPVEKSTLCNSK